MRRCILTILCVALLCGCASIVSKSTYGVRVNSVPADAGVGIYDRHGMEVYSGKTPFQVDLKSKAGYFQRAVYTIEFNKEGFAKKTIVLNATLNGWYFGNLLFGGAVGMLIVDPLTGAMYKLHESDIQEALTPMAGASTDRSASSLAIYNLQDIPAEWKDRLVLLRE